jgi:ATP-dependent exoDNAse (exonuclease V) beta subunit
VHKAKGREWPVVIVADLDSEPKGRLFDKPVATPGDGALDPIDPLAGRWIRLWPWPYAKQAKDTGLDERAAATPTGIADAAQAQREAARLLYVALTRARDWLILAPRVKETKKESPRLQTRWLDILGDLAPKPPATGEGPIRVGDAEHACSVRDLTAPDGDTVPAPTSLFAPALPVAPAVAVPRLIRPSSLAACAPPTMRATTLGPRLPFTGTSDMAAVGEAVHGFFAADRPYAEQALREAMAARLLRAWGVAALSPGDVVQAADRLWAWLRVTWPGCTWRAEVPVFQRIGMQRLSGRVDLVVEHAEGLVVLDHKTFPGRPDDWASRTAAHLPQLRAYAGALESATGRPVTGLVLHLPVAGLVHEVGTS